MPYKDSKKQKKAQHESYLRNKEKYRKKRKQRRKERRDFLNKYKADRGCLLCNEKRAPCLIFHHRDPSKKKYGINIIATHLYSDKIIIEELAKCDVICANCHRALHAKDNGTL